MISWDSNKLNIHWKDWCWSWNSNTLATWCEELTHWKRPWCWERLKAGGEGDDRGWDAWMASPTQWTWVWVNSGSWWGTGRTSALQSVGSQRVGHDWVTELNWILYPPMGIITMSCRKSVVSCNTQNAVFSLVFPELCFSVISSRETKWFSWSEALSVSVCFCAAVFCGHLNLAVRLQGPWDPPSQATWFAPFTFWLFRLQRETNFSKLHARATHRLFSLLLTCTSDHWHRLGLGVTTQLGPWCQEERRWGGGSGGLIPQRPGPRPNSTPTKRVSRPARARGGPRQGRRGAVCPCPRPRGPGPRAPA